MNRGGSWRGSLRGPAPALVALSTVFGGACAAGDRSTPDAALRSDSAGIEMIESPVPAWTPETRWRLSAEPTLTIGSFEGAEEEQLFRVSGAVELGDGRIAVANSGSQEIRVYGPDGSYDAALGGEGEGPGEFRFLSRLSRRGDDTLRVWDPSVRRISDLHPEAGFLRSITLGPTSGNDSPAYLGTMGDGSIVALAGDFPEPDELADDELIAGDYTYWKYGPSGELIGEMARFPQGERLVNVESSGGRMRSVQIITPPLRIGYHVEVVSVGLVVAASDAFEVRYLDPAGAVTRIARWGREPTPVTPALLEEWISGSELTPEQRRARRERWQAVPLPEYVPTARRALVGLDGSVWIEAYSLVSAEPSTWTILDASGTWLGELELPPRFRPFEIGDDYVLGSWRDDLDVEYVLVYELVRR